MVGIGTRSVHVFGPRGWFEAKGLTATSFKAALRASGAWRRISPADAEKVAEIYSDPLRNRAFAFLEAALGPRRALLAFNRLKALRVGIVGCGGIGSSVAYLLAGMGVRYFDLIDPDVVEEGNLPRQALYSLDDLGRPKAGVLANALRSRFRMLEVAECHADALSLECLTSLRTCSLVICSGDDPPTLGTELHVRLEPIPVWTCGYALGHSIVRPPKATKRIAKSPTITWRSVPNGFAPSIGFQNMEVAAACVSRLTFALARSSSGLSGADKVYELDYTAW